MTKKTSFSVRFCFFTDAKVDYYKKMATEKNFIYMENRFKGRNLINFV